MNNKYLVAVVAVVVGLVAGYFLFSGSTSLNGASITASNALNQQRLINELTLIANPLVGWISTSTTLSATALGPVGSATSTATTSITLPGAAMGDYLEFGISTSTNGVYVTCQMASASSVICAEQNTIAGQTPATTTVYIQDLPKASFVSPTGL